MGTPDDRAAPMVPSRDESADAQMRRGVSHAHDQIDALAQQVFVVATEVGALSTLLQERGIIPIEALRTQRSVIAKRLHELFQDQGIGVKREMRIPDKYALAPETLPQIDCESRFPLCRGACCTLRFALSAQDVEEGVMRWELDRPYMNRIGADQRCVHQDRSSYHCTIYPHRPGVCRLYDCRTDTRIWLDFERRVINPALFAAQPEGALMAPEAPREPVPDGGASTAAKE